MLLFFSLDQALYRHIGEGEENNRQEKKNCPFRARWCNFRFF